MLPDPGFITAFHAAIVGVFRRRVKRVGHLLGIYKNLRLLFPQNRDLADRWMSTRNKAFDNLTPVEVCENPQTAGSFQVGLIRFDLPNPSSARPSRESATLDGAGTSPSRTATASSPP
jgi:hypothetical protein